MRAAIYVHWAFCPYICPYCDFAKWMYDERAAERYVSALEAEIAHAPAVEATTVFYGGGTPNAYPADRAGARAGTAARTFRRARRRRGVHRGQSRSRTDRRLSLTLRAGGFNRLSIGAQSFEAPELHALGRRHSAADVAETVRRARAAGFGNVNVDLMFGVPGQTLASWERSLDAVLALEIEHVSTYGLTIEEGTPYARLARTRARRVLRRRTRSRDVRPRDRKADGGRLRTLRDQQLRPAGFRCEHNANYWRNGSYLGLGTGAASYMGGAPVRCPRWNPTAWSPSAIWSLSTRCG